MVTAADIVNEALGCLVHNVQIQGAIRINEILKVLPIIGSAPQPKVVFIMWVMPAGRPGSKKANVEWLIKSAPVHAATISAAYCITCRFKEPSD